MSDWFRGRRRLSDEEVLLDYVQWLERYRDGWYAVEINVSLLRPHHQHPQHRRIIGKTLEPLVKQFDAGVYTVANNNVVVLCKGAAVSDIDACLLRVKYLFSEDPLLAARNGRCGEDEFCTWYDLETDYQDFLTRVRAVNRAREENQETTATRSQAVKSRRRPGAMLDPRNLQLLERSIERADLANILRRQDICALVPGSRPAPVFHEVFFSMRYLADTVLPGYDVTSDKWLFQHLSRVLDQRMLALISQREYRDLLRLASLNLTLATVTGPEFLEFDRVISGKDRGVMSIELPAIEVFAEPGDYLFARDFLKERGYKLVIDGVPHLMLPLIDRNLLGFDLVKIGWTPALADHARGKYAADLREAIRRIGRERVILCRAGTDQAISVGESLGISLFQGRIIDNMLQAWGGEGTRPTSSR
ncbi:MAG TPA: hypothetical protein VND94_04375 [Terriglobia bacterium]|nr:hypothetical protein [Terriglobia bacterium]